MSLILVVDDMAVFREPIAASLRLKGYETICAANGKEALEIAQNHKPDLILLDLGMPIMDGMAVLKARQNNPYLKTTPVILLTALADKNHIIQAARMGVKDYLLKTHFSIDDLDTRIQKYLLCSTNNGIVGPSKTNNNPSLIDNSNKESSNIKNVNTPKSTSAGPEPTNDNNQNCTDEQTSAPKKVSSPEQDIHSTKMTTSKVKLDIEKVKELKPIMSRSQIREILDNSAELKGLSPTVAQILKLLRNPNCSINNIAKVVRQDQAISLKLLKLANSSIYTRGEPVETIPKAVMRIGLTQIRQVVLNIAVIDNFTNSKYINIANFWEHSISTGLIAAQIAKKLQYNETQIDAAFTMGLLHDVGRMVYIENLGEQYSDIMQIAQSMQLPLEQIESRMLLINHADAMDRILHTWRFPKELINPIALHQLSLGNIRRMAPRAIKEVALLGLANRLSHALLLGTSGNMTIYPSEEFARILELDRETIKEIEHHIPSDTNDIKFTLLSSINRHDWPNLKNEYLQQLSSPLNFVHISTEPDFDSLRIFFEQLRQPDTPETTTIAVVHIKNVRERIQLGYKLRQIEQELASSPLPLLIFSPMGNILLEDSIMARHQFSALPLPVPVDRILKTLNKLIPVAVL